MAYISDRQSYFSWNFAGEFYQATDEELARIKAAKPKGVTHARRITRGMLSKTWSQMGDKSL